MSITNSQIFCVPTKYLRAATLFGQLASISAVVWVFSSGPRDLALPAIKRSCNERAEASWHNQPCFLGFFVADQELDDHFIDIRPPREKPRLAQANIVGGNAVAQDFGKLTRN